MPSSSLFARAVLTLALLGGFYVLALGIAAGLLWLPYASYLHFGRIDLRLSFWGVTGAGAILWSFRPRRDVFDPPGPAIREADQPELFAVLREIATKTKQEMPADVFLVPDVNAFVSQRGGFSGVGGRRIMGLGVPLMQMLTVTEFKAVLAHEFGHFHAGDVALGPLVYRTRQAIGRALEAVSGSLLELVFDLYGKLFLRVSAGVSRHQEFLADGLAAHVVGGRPLSSGLKKVAGATPVFQWYLHSEVMPVLDAGFVPPLTDGFTMYLQQSAVQDVLKHIGEAEMTAASADVYDSHPPLSERVAALMGTPESGMPDDSRPALALLRSASEHDADLASHLRAADAPRRPIEWSDVVELVHLPGWKNHLNARKRHLATMSFEDLPSGVSATAALALKLRETLDTGTDEEELARRFAAVIGMAAAVKLHAAGWTFHSGPGAPIGMSNGSRSFEPFGSTLETVMGEMSSDEWRALCQQTGLGGPVA